MRLEYTRIHESGPSVLIEDGYQFWRDRTSGQWRWALIFWPDNGLGIAGHGSCLSLQAAYDAAQINRRVRESVA